MATTTATRPCRPSEAPPVDLDFKQIRWPLEPLLEATHLRPGELRVALHLSTATLDAALTDGLSDRVADRWAIRLRRHPAQVWPEWIDAGLRPIDRDYLAGGWRQAWLFYQGVTP
jgi:hypothetical protein